MKTPVVLAFALLLAFTPVVAAAPEATVEEDDGAALCAGTPCDEICWAYTFIFDRPCPID